ncbi:hypothetical protein LOK49_LG10G01577 [Camellia lanceoleosa]|uniref:Uncharacterized protein n=1 Tax=Camellia lanceoleosa TaxID=1840588 RepID=A0ACC0GA78_9ERIC|nr:hypothetical protein LOK49_LG10G01577 [Camellia lanceoleosa]
MFLHCNCLIKCLTSLSKMLCQLIDSLVNQEC